MQCPMCRESISIGNHGNLVLHFKALLKSSASTSLLFWTFGNLNIEIILLFLWKSKQENRGLTLSDYVKHLRNKGTSGGLEVRMLSTSQQGLDRQYPMWKSKQENPPVSNMRLWKSLAFRRRLQNCLHFHNLKYIGELFEISHNSRWRNGQKMQQNELCFHLNLRLFLTVFFSFI